MVVMCRPAPYGKPTAFPRPPFPEASLSCRAYLGLSARYPLCSESTGLGKRFSDASNFSVKNGNGVRGGSEPCERLQERPVPRQHSTGGKERLLGISKRGDRYLRKLLVHGARATVRTVRRLRPVFGPQERGAMKAEVATDAGRVP
jgi:hypothetical protein